MVRERDTEVLGSGRSLYGQVGERQAYWQDFFLEGVVRPNKRRYKEVHKKSEGKHIRLGEVPRRSPVSRS